METAHDGVKKSSSEESFLELEVVFVALENLCYFKKKKVGLVSCRAGAWGILGKEHWVDVASAVIGGASHFIIGLIGDGHWSV